MNVRACVWTGSWRLAMDTYRTHAVLILLLLSSDICLPSQFPTQLIIKEWVDQMQIELVTLADMASAGKNLTQIFLDNQNLYTVESNDAEELVAGAARNIEQLLLKRAAALETLATFAENFQMEHQWKDEYADGDIVYYNAKDNLEVNETEGRKNRIRPAFKEDMLFKRLTSHNHTAVHIPTDIYDGSTIVLNELNWTEALEGVFKKNREDDPTLLWQVFGSATGLARYYPASPWMDARKTPSKIDLYDVRRRPWYIQGAASPKDMLILVDASGSVSGLTLKLIRTSVGEMLETLSDDDYVNVVYFNTRVNNTACFDHLVQANVRNKKILKDAVQNISAKGITNYTKGFEFAFEQLYATNITRANCNKIIMLFTDGGEERASAILQKYNADKKVRIFTFSVGQHNYDKGPVQWMACANKGYFYEIPSIGAIRINTQEYLDVLGRPMVLADQLAKQVQWTNVYLDALELGLVITGTLPVFNKTKYKDESGLEIQNQLILGVMGIDVSLDDIKKLTPRYTIGPNGYYFAIDPNGYVLLHPNLQPKKRIRNHKTRLNKPYAITLHEEPVTLDFLDAELENDIKVQIRRMMIDGNPGEETIETLVKTQDERYIDRGVRTYTWAQVNGTDYSLALVLPTYSEHYIQAKLGDTIRQAMAMDTLRVEMFDELGYTFIAPREYCKGLKDNDNNTQFLLDFNQFIDRNTLEEPCNVTLVSRLLLDAGLTADLVKLWKEQSLGGILARFVATDGGITRVYPRSAGEEWTENAETYDSSFYKRTLDNNIYIFTAPYFNKSRESGYESGILVSKAVDLNIDGVNLKPAVVGVKLNVSAWMNNFMNATIKVNCKDEICGCLKNNKHVDCVILDDGGFLLMSNQDEYITQIGQFFGEVDPVVMISLVNTSLYSFNKTYDYQSVCDPERDSKAAAGPRSVYVPTIADMLSIGWWASTATWSIMQQVFYGLIFPSFVEAVDSDDDMSANMFKESCITEQTQYFFDNEERSYSGVLDCGNCSRMYRAEKLPHTNLVFLITDAKATCLSCDPRPLRQAEQPSQGPDPCELAQNPRYRKGPDVCFDNNIDDEPLCPISGVSGLSPVPLLLLLQVLMLGPGRMILTVGAEPL
ncbi:voltage-dependent calcium channel subunit alpha-2/delta-1-like isoform X1 [Oncorhynchus keta]|uniref:voltage-dependent calcium channel subunit alpha-2/delta-1-like isoform X1 n=1 Tax=Oncorhynchus keta TaxID=8018 RepID=UPI00227A53A9|nr:voltage-dependent calcium channel subunit alpha-2/delta-1-like isoform X1 [Oncorhynchus keta]